ncbi:MAG: hypothetical protein V4501_02955 [Pseudomonadota bacterium]
MYIFRTIVISVLSTLAFSNISFAWQPPTLCPTVEQIQAAVAQHEDYIKTPSSTIFTFNYHILNEADSSGIYWYLLMRVKTYYKSQTKPKALEALQSLAYKSGPTFETDDLYICRYTNALGFETKLMTAM